MKAQADRWVADRCHDCLLLAIEREQQAQGRMSGNGIACLGSLVKDERITRDEDLVSLTIGNISPD